MMSSTCCDGCSRGLRSARGMVWLTICIVPPPTSFFSLHQPEVGLDAGGVAVHHQPDRAGRGEDRGLAVAHAELLAVAHGRRSHAWAGWRFRPALRSESRVRRQRCCSYDFASGRCLRRTLSMWSRVLGEPGERAHPAGGAGARGIRVTGHQRGDRAAQADPRPSRTAYPSAISSAPRLA